MHARPTISIQAGLSAHEPDPLQTATKHNSSAKNFALRSQTKPTRRLNLRQLNAIELLVIGASDAVVARSVGVHRVTVTRWRLYNSLFRRALELRREQVWNGAGDRLRSRLHDAVKLLERQMHSGDPLTSYRAAKGLLTMVQIGKPPSDQFL